MHIAFVGTPNFSKKVLKKSIESGVDFKAVVTGEDKPRGRGQKDKPTPVKKLAKENNIDVFHNLQSVSEKTDLVIVAAYGEIIDQKTLNKPKHGFLNIHPSLLPKYRGPSPIHAAILNGDSKTGVSIISMTEEVDKGPIVTKKEIEINKPYYSELEDKLAKMSGEMIANTVPKWIEDKIELKKQNEKKASYTSYIEKEEGEIDWENSADYIERKIRAYEVWPGCYSYLEGKLLKILKAEVQKQTGDGPFGPPGKTYLGTNNTIAVQTGKDFLIVKKLQLEGKTPTSSKDFLQGNEDLIGVQLG